MLGHDWDLAEVARQLNNTFWWNTQIKVTPSNVYEEMGHAVVFVKAPTC